MLGRKFLGQISDDMSALLSYSFVIELLRENLFLVLGNIIV